ncbi:hypothetical protein MKW98_021441 [Papaver atlanticum]|uniref:Neprosin PEP catalytic domain-containing protein n=1 Tax=Papaver atlanticum TaxID=357466 RepID=A0AAD4XJ81_9MAGN|nr:hypothetical protein MKW98_021441 [Papaver atlanticum]
MGKRVILYGFGGKFCFLLVLASMVSSFGLDEESISKENDLEIERKLEMLNKPAVKSIQSEDGDVIDCVDIYKQPSLDHPALKNHNIQMTPTITYPKTESVDTRNNASRSVSQVWQKSGSCPEGTIPIRRIQKQDLLRAGSLDRYGMKSPYVFSNPNNTVYDITPNKTHNFNYLNQTGVSDASYSPYSNRSLAVLLTLGYNYTGARGEISVWNPQVEIPEGPDREYSAAQIWVANGDYLDESIEAGWIVHPHNYGDNATRFFIYWTVDNSGTGTGCFNLLCPGFVQTNNEIVLGGKLDVSSFEGQQYHMSLFIYWDNNTQCWWLEYDGKQVGYWPSELFGALKQSAATVQWGGEVQSNFLSQRKTNHTHTSAKMGNGIEALHHYSAWIRNIKIIDNSTVEKYPEWVHEYMDEPDCYSSYNWVENVEEPVFYFGGPGRSPKCP